MELGIVIGNVVSSVKHPSYSGCKLMLVESVDTDLQPIGLTTVAVDAARAGVGDLVLVAREGRAAGDVIGRRHVPVRSVIVGVVNRIDVAEAENS